MGMEFEKFAATRPYTPEAYEFVLHALNYTLRELGEQRHVSGSELSDGIRRLARSEFGPMAKHVLNAWGIHTTRDFGEVVFALVGSGHLRKTDEDRIEDFEDRFDFQQAFERDYYVEPGRGRGDAKA